VRGATRAVGILVALMIACEGERGARPFVGTVERTAIEVSASVSEVLVECPARLGERVTAGQPLVRLDDEVARARLDAATARLAATRAVRRETGPELARVRGLHRKGVASQHDLDRARRAHDQAIAGEREAEAVLAEATKRLSERTLLAPVDGVVDQLPFDCGERVPAGGVVAVVLADLPPWVRIWLPSEMVARVRIDSAALIEIDGIEEPLRGRVIEIAREPEFTPHFALTEREREHLVFETRVEILDPPDGLRPGVPAEVRLPAEGGDSG
jgi:HlyD family secretion protein